MNRLFTFGCSFTKYIWPTWADILSKSKKYDFFENCAHPGAGNHFIFYRLIECIERNKITKNDTIAIMWSSIGREDRWIKGSWMCGGSIYKSKIVKKFGSYYIDHFTDPTGFLITNSAIIHATYQILKNIGCKFYFFAFTPILEVDDSQSVWSKFLKIDTNFYEKQISKLYKESLEYINKNYLSCDDSTKLDRYDRDYIFTDTDFQSKYNECKGISWPDVADYINGNLKSVPKHIIDEISFYNLDLKSRRDTHPKPLDHLKWLEQLNIFTIDENQKNFALEWSEKVTENKISDWKISILPDYF